MSKKVKRLFAGFVPDHYQLQLDPDRDTRQLTGIVTISGKKTGRPAERLTFHQHGLKITAATIIKKDKKGEHAIEVTRINHHNGFDEVRLHASELLYPGAYTVTMQFTGKIQDGMHGIYTCNYELDGNKQQLVATQFESHHAREAFPCIDEPEAKATFDLTLVSPKNEAVIGNMPARRQTEKDGKLHTVFETSPKMSTYLLAFVYGDLQHKQATTKGGVDVRIWTTKAHQQVSLDFALDVATRGIEFFNDYYGVPYPLAKCDHVALPDFSSGAMENWGLITYRETCLIADPQTASQSSRELIATVILHELSHQWFGNLVTMRWWDDLWLNESFANVMEYVATDALFPQWHIWSTFITSEGLAAIRRDSIAGVQAVKTEVRHPDEISTLFDPSIVYAKGGRLLNMLMNYLGEADFRKGLKAYFTKHQYANTTGDDLWSSLGTASGKDVAGFMNPWLLRSGFPVVTVEQAGKEVQLSQQHFLLDPQKADAERVWPVPLLSNSADVPVLLDKPQVTAGLKADDFVRINQGALGHYVVRYAVPQHAAAIAKLVEAKQLDAPERLMLLSDSAMLARAGQLSFADTMQLLEHYADEDAEPVWDIIALVLADCRRFIDIAPELEEPIKALIRTLIKAQFDRLGWVERPKESSQDTKLRGIILGLGIYAKHKTIVSHALELFDAYKSDPQSVPSELRDIVFGAAVRNKVPGAFAWLLELEETTSNVDLKQDVMGALSLTEDGAQIAMLLGRLKDSDKVRQHDVDRWLIYLMRNRHARDQAWKWLRGNWDWIEQTFGEDKSYDNFPRYAASAFSTSKLLKEYQTFFEPLQDRPALARNIAMGIEELNNRVAWLERDLPLVKAYF
ncbi:MAG TPA: M1 family metallopeptidase [Nevskiaceae bacterium]|nr:M1 family metallopeptidase [Nevskiaceae bacterium]